MNYNEEIFLYAYKLYTEGRREELKELFESKAAPERQRQFEEYIVTPFHSEKTRYIPCLYGEVNGMQVFTNNYSLYEVKKPFMIKMPSRRISGLTINPERDDEKVIEALAKMKKYMQNKSRVHVCTESIGDHIHTVFSDENEVTFNANYLLQMEAILGYNMQFYLSDHESVLMGENENGKAYVLGRNKLAPAEVRKFVTK